MKPYPVVTTASRRLPKLRRVEPPAPGMQPVWLKPSCETIKLELRAPSLET